MLRSVRVALAAAFTFALLYQEIGDTEWRNCRGE